MEWPALFPHEKVRSQQSIENGLFFSYKGCISIFAAIPLAGTQVFAVLSFASVPLILASGHLEGIEQIFHHIGPDC